MPGRSGRPDGARDVRALRLEPVPKPRGGVRWITRLGATDEAAYRAAVRPLTSRIDRSLGPEVLASRTRPSPDGRLLAPWRPAREAWRRAVATALRRAHRDDTFAVADIRDCYGSITPGTVLALLGPEAAHAVSLLRRLGEHGVRGLPIGPEPSAVLANAVLAGLDDALRGAGVHHLRWVDDLVLWGTPADVRRAMTGLRRAAGERGLALHEGKTKVLAEREELRALALGGRDSSIIAAP